MYVYLVFTGEGGEKGGKGEGNESILARSNIGSRWAPAFVWSIHPLISDVNQGSPSGKPIKSQEVGTCYGPLLLIPGITV